MELINLYSGRRCELQAIADDAGRCRLKQFIESLDMEDQRAVVAFLNEVADYGPPRNDERSRKVEDAIFEFRVRRHNSYHRLLWFYGVRTDDEKMRVVLTGGYQKKADKADQDEIERARRLKAEYDRKLLK